jgi:RNase P/RNase MRP subunit p30
MKKNPLHYVDNEQFLESMIKYKNEVKQAKETDEPPPPIPEYLGECFLKIANRLSFRPNFINYAFREDKEQNYSYETMTHDQKVNMYSFISNFEESKKKKKAIAKKKSSTSLELFMSTV